MIQLDLGRTLLECAVSDQLCFPVVHGLVHGSVKDRGGLWTVETERRVLVSNQVIGHLKYQYIIGGFGRGCAPNSNFEIQIPNLSHTLSQQGKGATHLIPQPIFRQKDRKTASGGVGICFVCLSLLFRCDVVACLLVCLFVCFIVCLFVSWSVLCPVFVCACLLVCLFACLL